MSSVKQQLIKMIKQNSPDTTGECTIKEVDVERNTILIDFVTNKGAEYKNVMSSISFMPGVKASIPKRGERYVVGFANGNPMTPFLINRISDSEDSSFLYEYQDALSLENAELLDFS